MDKESIYGFHNNKKAPFLKIYVSLQKLIAPARRILENGFSCPGYSLKSYTTYESNIDFEVMRSNQQRLVFFNTSHDNQAIYT